MFVLSKMKSHSAILLTIQFVSAVPMRNFGVSTSAMPAPSEVPFNDDSSWVDSALSSVNMPTYSGSSIDSGSDSNEKSGFFGKLVTDPLPLGGLGDELPGPKGQLENGYEFVLGSRDPEYFTSDEEWSQSKPSSFEVSKVDSTFSLSRVKNNSRSPNGKASPHVSFNDNSSWVDSALSNDTMLNYPSSSIEPLPELVQNEDVEANSPVRVRMKSIVGNIDFPGEAKML